MTAPEFMSDRAKEVWVSTLAAHPHVSATAHRDLLATYCEAVARFEQAITALNTRDSLTVDSTKGTEMIAPEARLARDESAAIRQIAAELLITPKTTAEQLDPVEDELANLKRKKEQLATASPKP